MAGKKFKFRTDANRRPGIKEVINRGMSVRGQRVSISVGLDRDFNLSRKHIIADNIFVPIKDTKGLKKGWGIPLKIHIPLLLPLSHEKTHSLSALELYLQ